MAEKLGFLNKNGLVSGNIPPKTPCPFVGDCVALNDRCPRPNNLHEAAYSCAIARAFSMTKVEEE